MATPVSVSSDLQQKVIKRFARSWVLGGALFFATILWMGYYFGSRFLEEEANRKAMRLTCALVEHYYRTQQKWPASWNAIESISDQKQKELVEGLYLDWPTALKDIQQRIIIDFHFNPSEYDKSGKQKFTAIRPLQTTTGIVESEECQKLLEAIKKARP